MVFILIRIYKYKIQSKERDKEKNPFHWKKNYPIYLAIRKGLLVIQVGLTKAQAHTHMGIIYITHGSVTTRQFESKFKIEGVRIKS